MFVHSLVKCAKCLKLVALVAPMTSSLAPKYAVSLLKKRVKRLQETEKLPGPPASNSKRINPPLKTFWRYLVCLGGEKSLGLFDDKDEDEGVARRGDSFALASGLRL
jgi:hypothetical protein